MFGKLLVFFILLHQNQIVLSFFKSEECPGSYFKCGDGTCISSMFLCDNDLDCTNGADEKCNGTVHQNVKNVICEDDKINCPGQNLCIPKKWVCDNHNDCLNGFDEQNCKNQVPCAGFRCKSGDCIPKKWQCDGNIDCIDKSDEENCKKSSKKSDCIRENGFYECLSGACISHKLVCNGHKDCPDGDDEGKSCKIGGCHTRNCTHGCFETPQGPQCECNEGYKLASDQRTCNDIDECKQSNENICSQKCQNTKGGFVCSCELGFDLVNSTKCEVSSSEPVLIYTDRRTVRGYWLSSKRHFLIARGNSNAMGVDMHGESKLVYWTDIGKNSSYVLSAHFNEKKVKTVVSAGLMLPEDIAVDHLANNIYITDAGLKQIIVCKIDGSSCTPIVKNYIDNIRAITLDLDNMKIFWTDWGKHPGIYTSKMDGSSMKVLVDRNIVWPNGITYDRFKNRIYWSDAKLERIEYYDFKLEKRFVLIDDAVYHPFCLTIFEDSLYWADWETYSITSSNKFTGHNLTSVIRRFNHVFGMHIYHPVNYRSTANPCWSASCSHLCLLVSPKEYRCACPNHMKLENTYKKTCIEKEDETFLLAGLGKKIKKIYPKNIGKDVTKTILSKVSKEIETITDYAFSHKKNELYVYDSTKKNIVKINVITQNYKVILKNLTSVFSLTYDEYSNNLYWLDVEKGLLEVAKSDGKKRITLIEDLKHPSALALYQERNELFIGLMGVQPLIMIADLNGKNKKTFINNIGLPTSLAICKKTKNLYWSDAEKGTIEYVSLTNPTTKSVAISGIGHIESLVIKDRILYWTDMDSSNLYILSLIDSTKKIKQINIGGKKNLIKKIILVSKKYIENDCLSTTNKCSDVCLFNGYKTINNITVPLTQCICPPHMSLGDNKKTCDYKSFCPPGFFTCASTKECIKLSDVCDGHKNCANNEDEIGCPEIKPCSTYESRCDSKNISSPCISNSWFCDGEEDCEGGLDEMNCHNFTAKSILSDVAHKAAINNKCEEGYFKCDQNVCLPWHFVCNGEINCKDKSDEGKDCLVNCSCKNNGKCHLKDDVWYCQCPPGFEGRDCEIKKTSTLKSSEPHQVIIQKSIHSQGILSKEELFKNDDLKNGSFWVVMLLVLVVLLISITIFLFYLYINDKDGQLYLIKKNVGRRLNLSFRNNSFRKSYDYNSATVDLLDQIECEHDEDLQTNQNFKK